MTFPKQITLSEENIQDFCFINQLYWTYTYSYWTFIVEIILSKPMNHTYAVIKVFVRLL